MAGNNWGDCGNGTGIVTNKNVLIVLISLPLALLTLSKTKFEDRSHSRIALLSDYSLDPNEVGDFSQWRAKISVPFNSGANVGPHFVPTEWMFERHRFATKAKMDPRRRRHRGGRCCGDVVQAGCMEIEFQGYWEKLIE